MTLLMAIPSPFPVYCVLAGEAYADHYVDRLFYMLGRHMPVPFELTCLTDRPRPLHPAIRQRVCVDANLKGLFTKMKLLDRAEVDQEAFLYVDVTSVIFKSLTPLLNFGALAGKAMVAVPDWKFGWLNSSVLYVRPCEVTQRIWEDYSSGKVYAMHRPADQDYMLAAMKAHGTLDELELFPPEWVVSFDQLRRDHRRNPASLERTLATALVVKFHGTPKPHLLLHPRTALRMALRKPLTARHDFGFMCDFLLEHWR